VVKITIDSLVDKSYVKRYVVTGAQYNAPVNKELYNNLIDYCELNDAELIVVPMKKSYEESYLADILHNHDIVTKDKKLNNKIKVIDDAILPTRKLPLSGQGRFTQSDVSAIYSSPKQHMNVVPTSNNKLPKVLMTTGAVTLPAYNMRHQAGRIAHKDHTYGAIIVEVVDKNLYHYRQLTAQKNGTFYDLGTRYETGKAPRHEDLEALVLGDWHTGDTCPKARKAAFQMIQQYDPKRIILHDFFNGSSINHHEEKDLVAQYKTHKKIGLSLEDELKRAAKELKSLVKVANGKQIVLVKSNHDEFLDRYLKNTRFVKDPQNAMVASELLTEMLKGKDPLKAGIGRYYDIPKNVKFLTRDQDYKVRGWQLGNHGDLGANGSRGSVRSKEFANGKSISAHGHAPKIFRNVFLVGTNTKLKLNYNRGFSSWMNTNGIIHKNGKVQLVNIINGKWTTFSS